MSLSIVRAAAGSALQDEGRPGWRRCGVPPGGAFDRESFALALALVGRVGGPVLEMPLLGGEFVCRTDDRLAVTGAAAMVRLDGRELGTQVGFSVRAGQRLTVEAPILGVRTYLATQHGWTGRQVLGSYSNQVPQEPETGAASVPAQASLRLEHPPDSLRVRPLRVLTGPNARPSDELALSAAALSVGLASNRLGVRLEGGKFEPIAVELRSEPSCLGAVQLTPSGELIVHGPDGPTLGGYPKIATVIEADLDRLAQLRPGDAVRFQWVSLEEARDARLQRRRRIEALVRSIRTASG